MGFSRQGYWSGVPLPSPSLLAAAAKSLQSCPALCNPIDGSHQAPPSLGFSRQEHWSGLPFPSPMHESEKWKWSHSVMSDSSDPTDCSPPGSSIHGIFQARVLEWGAIAFSALLANSYLFSVFSFTHPYLQWSSLLLILFTKDILFFITKVLREKLHWYKFFFFNKEKT